MMSSSSDDRTVERGTVGPIGASLTKARLRDFVIVFWFNPYRAAKFLSGAFCIIARMACVVVALHEVPGPYCLPECRIRMAKPGPDN